WAGAPFASGRAPTDSSPVSGLRPLPAAGSALDSAPVDGRGAAAARWVSALGAVGTGAGPGLPGRTASPSPANTAIGVLTFTLSVPSGTRIFEIVPSSAASISMVALSV